MKNLKNKKDRKFGKDLIYSVIESMIIDGLLKENDLKNYKQLSNKVINFIPEKDNELYFITTYQELLIDVAKKYIKSKDFNFAYIFFATYFEHFINEIFIIWSRRNKISHKTLKELIRHSNLEDKYTWLLEILKLPKFNSMYYKIIKELSDKRNSFIHYKYEPELADNTKSLGDDFWVKNKIKIMKTIKYCKTYRSIFVFNGNKNNINI